MGEFIEGRFVSWGYNYGQIVQVSDEIGVEKLIGDWPTSVQKTGEIIYLKRSQAKIICKPRRIHRCA